MEPPAQDRPRDPADRRDPVPPAGAPPRIGGGMDLDGGADLDGGVDLGGGADLDGGVGLGGAPPDGGRLGPDLEGPDPFAGPFDPYAPLDRGPPGRAAPAAAPHEAGEDDLIRPVGAARPSAPAGGDADAPAADGAGRRAPAPPPARVAAPPARTASGRIVAREAARPRLAVRVRCAYCHDALGDAPALTCPGCATRLHTVCVQDDGRCPTLGCRATLPAPTRSLRERIARWTERRRAARLAAGPPRPAGPPTRLRVGLRVVGGLLLPLACFFANERLNLRGDAGLIPEWRYDALWSWVFQLHTAEAQRPLYPLLLWSLLAFAAALLGRRGRWVEVGLRGGVILAAGFSLLFVRVLPVSVIGIIVMGLGLLGLGPYVALASYWAAWRRYRAERPAGEEAGADGEALALWGAWALMGGTGAAMAAMKMTELWQRLPTTPPQRCFVATAAARGAPRLTGAEEVRFADGRRAAVTRQLRTLKLFELLLAAACPRAHAGLRAAYDRLGPPLAATLARGPVGGTLAWAALLPAQALARVTLGLALRDAGRAIDRTYPAPGAAARPGPAREVAAAPRSPSAPWASLLARQGASSNDAFARASPTEPMASRWAGGPSSDRA